MQQGARFCSSPWQLSSRWSDGGARDYHEAYGEDVAALLQRCNRCEGIAKGHILDKPVDKYIPERSHSGRDAETDPSACGQLHGRAYFLRGHEETLLASSMRAACAALLAASVISSSVEMPQRPVAQTCRRESPGKRKLLPHQCNCCCVKVLKRTDHFLQCRLRKVDGTFNTIVATTIRLQAG